MKPAPIILFTLAGLGLAYLALAKALPPSPLPPPLPPRPPAPPTPPAPSTPSTSTVGTIVRVPANALTNLETLIKIGDAANQAVPHPDETKKLTEFLVLVTSEEQDPAHTTTGDVVGIVQEDVTTRFPPAARIIVQHTKEGVHASPTTAAAPVQPPIPSMGNPASTNCVAKGGRLQIIDTPKGQVGMCLFPDGTRCEEWDLMHGRCAQGQVPSVPVIPGMPQPAPFTVGSQLLVSPLIAGMPLPLSLLPTAIAVVDSVPFTAEQLIGVHVAGLPGMPPVFTGFIPRSAILSTLPKF